MEAPAISPAEGRKVFCVTVLLAVVVFAGLLPLFPWASDGMFTSYDPIHYALGSEARPWRAVSGHHPLYHVALNVAALALGSAGIDQPVRLGVRALGALGCAGMIILVMIAGGSARILPALLFALFLASTRAFVLEGAAGENVPLGCALAMLAILLACREGCRPWTVAAALVLAILARQDNILVAPAVVWAVAAHQPAGRRWRTAVAVLIGAGVVCVAGYVAIWAAWIAPSTDLRTWLFGFSIRDGAILQSWTPQDLGESRLLIHLGTLPVALIGEQGWDWSGHGITIFRYLGAAVAGIVIVGALLLQGRRPRRKLVLACIMVIACRFPFFSWFEPLNFEWWLLPIGLLAMAGAGWTRGAPRWPPAPRRCGLGLLLAVAIGQLLLHGPCTWSLRESRLQESAHAAILEFRRHPECRLAAYETRAGLALRLAGGENPVVLRGDPETCLDGLRGLTRESAVLLFFDREVWEGMPSTRNQPDALTWVDQLTDIPHLQAFRRRGRVHFAILDQGE